MGEQTGSRIFHYLWSYVLAMPSSRHIRYALWHDRECLGHRPAGQSCRSSRAPQDKNLYSIPLQALLCATGNSDVR
ncbi:hypothetical protein FOXYSP1_15942 [Fusarium oxysporum f. sp. phaseoli]